MMLEVPIHREEAPVICCIDILRFMHRWLHDKVRYPIKHHELKDVVDNQHRHNVGKPVSVQLFGRYLDFCCTFVVVGTKYMRRIVNQCKHGSTIRVLWQLDLTSILDLVFVILFTSRDPSDAMV